VEYYLTEKILGIHHAQVKDIFFYRWGRPANSLLSKLTERHLTVHSWVEPLFIANDWIPGGDKFKIMPSVAIRGSRDIEGLLGRIGTQLKFTKEETLEGQSFLHSIGIKNEKFVCMIVRDSKYLPRASYHNYRDSEIESFDEATLALAKKGYWVFRMGKVTQKLFKSDHPRILDYANSDYRSDFLDIWLMANCFFCISTGTGLDEVARIFRRPAVYVNNIPLHQLVTYDHVITTPKHLVWKETNKQLTLSEHLAYPYYHTNQYDNEKILVVDLTPKDIKQAVLEMEARLSGSWEESEEDRQLQDKFWEIFQTHQDFYKNHGVIHPEARFGTHFLRNNPEWLK
jgi:putative glycosyltransferase (TIGR04372 family)